MTLSIVEKQINKMKSLKVWHTKCLITHHLQFELFIITVCQIFFLRHLSLIIANFAEDFLLAISLCRGGITYATVFNLPARRQPHSIFWVFVRAGTICLFPDP